PVTPWVPLAGPVLWLLICRVPAFYENLDARVIGASVLVAIYFLAAAREFAVKDGLLTRFAVTVILLIHAAAVLLRIPFAMFDHVRGISTINGVGWFGLATFEAAIF